MEQKQALEALKKKNNLTDKQVANIMGVNERTVRSWRSGRINMSTQSKILIKVLLEA